MTTKKKDMFRLFGFDRPLLIITLAIIFIGWVCVYSSSSLMAAEKYHQQLYFLIHQVIGSLAGLVLVGVIVSIRRQFFRNPTVVYGLLIVNVLLLGICFAMPAVRGTHRWIQMFGIRFQPSELAKITLVLFLAHYLEEKKDRLHEIKILAFPVAVLAVFLLLIIKEPDFGTSLLLAMIGGIMLFIGGVKFRYLALLGLVASGFFAVHLFKTPYQLDRVTSFMHPAKDPLGSSYQVIQSKIAVGSGGLLGVSIGESKQKLFFLPYAHTDFIYAIIGEEFGLLGTLMVLALFIGFLWRGLTVASRAPGVASQLIVIGLTLVISIQALLNISIVLGLGPAKGIPLPLISYGRSSLLCNLIAIGLILNVSERKALNGAAS